MLELDVLVAQLFFLQNEHDLAISSYLITIALCQ